MKSQVYSQAEVFNFTMKRIQEVKEVEEIEGVEEVVEEEEVEEQVEEVEGVKEVEKEEEVKKPWIFRTSGLGRPTKSPFVKIPTTSLSFLTLVNIFS